MREDGKTTGVIFDVQKFSLHDGAGIRTLVFLKGCPLSCAWCSNPEGRSPSPDLLYAPGRCIGASDCGKCIPACPANAIRGAGERAVGIDRPSCDNCGDCVSVCPSRALELCGRRVTADDVIRMVDEDGIFYARSGGGLTLGGGEPLLQPDFAAAVLAAARARGLGTVIETSGLCSWKALEAVAPHVDRIFYDIKSLDPARHRVATGVSNGVILENFRRLRARLPGIEVVVRTAIVPGVNDSEADIRAIARFILEAGGARGYELLPYHALGGPKYARLGRIYAMSEVEPPPHERMAALSRIAARVSSPSS